MLDPFRPETAGGCRAPQAPAGRDPRRLQGLGARAPRRASSRATRRRSSPANSGPAGAALELGLVDGLGELRATLQARYGAKVHLPVIGPRAAACCQRFGLGAAIDGIGPDARSPRSKSACTGNVSDSRSPAAMKLRSPVHPRTSPPCAPGSIRSAKHCRAIDYEGARPIFAEDMIAFGTFTDFMIGRDLAEQKQWRNVWGTIRNFRYDLDKIEAIVSADRLTAVGMGVVAVRRLPSQRRSASTAPGRTTVDARPQGGGRSVRRHPHPHVAVPRHARAELRQVQLTDHASRVARLLFGFQRQSGAPGPAGNAANPARQRPLRLPVELAAEQRPTGRRQSQHPAVPGHAAGGGTDRDRRPWRVDQVAHHRPEEEVAHEGQRIAPELGIGEKLARRARPLGQGGERLALGQRQAVRRPRQLLQVPLQGGLEERQVTQAGLRAGPRAARASWRARQPRRGRRARAAGG